MMLLPFILLVAAAGCAVAHPMGNFSVSHYARFDVRPGKVELTYVLDLAEIPTFELLQRWNIDARDRDAVRVRAGAQAREWLPGLTIASGSRILVPQLERTTTAVMDGAGGLPVLRVTMLCSLPGNAGELQYEDRNYAGRTGWKEIVVVSHGGVRMLDSTQDAADRSHALEAYPADAIGAPPQDLQASFHWSMAVAAAKAEPAPDKTHGPASVPLSTPEPQPKPAPGYAEQLQARSAGAVVRGDYLSRMLGGREISLGAVLIGVCMAFGLGAMHAMSPGHGKTIVAAYLVGTRGTPRHAAFLGAMVTFTHTISVFLLGLGVLLLQNYVVPEKVIPALGTISGLSIVAVGAALLYQRSKALGGRNTFHHHHDHGHVHAHEYGPVHHHHHPHDGSHAHPHSHVPEGRLSLAGLVGLGISGGLVPCPSALVLLLSAIALGRTGLGLILLAGFSAGLALVLMSIGILVLYAKRLLPAGRMSGPVLRYAPVFSAAVVIVLGLLMTGVSMGWIQPGRIIG